MKKLKSLGTVAIATVLLTSCLDGSNESTQMGAGVVKMSIDAMGNNVVYVDDNYSIYSPALKNLTENDCIMFSYTISRDDPANNSGNKYLTASNLVVTNKFDNSGRFSAVDTSNIIKNEITAIDAKIALTGMTGITIKDYFWVSTSHEKVTPDQGNNYILQGDYNQEPQIVDGKRVYDLFLRVVKTSDGKGVTGTNTFIYTFNVGSFFKALETREKDAGNESLNIRLNYIKKFDEDTTSVTEWGKTNLFEFKIAKESN